MAIFGIVSQKGGVGKSTLARLLAVHYARKKQSVKIADLDTQQLTVVNWLSYRGKDDIEAQGFNSVNQAVKDSKRFKAFIFDAEANASLDTSQICKASDLLLLPTSVSLDDLGPQIALAKELINIHKVKSEKILFVLIRTSSSETKIAEIQKDILESGFRVAVEYLPSKDGYSTALSEGKGPQETRFEPLNQRAEKLAIEITKGIK